MIFKFQKQYFISDFQTMSHDKPEILNSNFPVFWVRQLAYQQQYVGSGLQNIKMLPLVLGTDKENIT